MFLKIINQDKAQKDSKNCLFLSFILDMFKNIWGKSHNLLPFRFISTKRTNDSQKLAVKLTNKREQNYNKDKTEKAEKIKRNNA